MKTTTIYVILVGLMYTALFVYTCVEVYKSMQ